ncbi:MAG: thiol:disulfide interchange protein DsbG [Gammaproteobacteria bacterium]|nr:MAG: thiol:disulfide interchange protein DsbG [Gammaproteobacteria bacterium]UTW42212.1 thiol:disulfide interchange protein DsbG [bacterium SCSIO 12844]
MKKKFSIKQGLLIGLLASTLTLAGCFSSNTANPKKAEKLVNKVTYGQAKIIRSFDANDQLYGYVIQSKGGQEGILYVAKDGSFLFSGSYYNQDGVNQQRIDYEKYIQPKTAIAAFKEAKNTHYIEQGKQNAPHKAYIIADPNCHFCHLLYQSLQPEIQSGNLAVRWILIGAVKPDSAAKTMAIFDSANPLKALEENEHNFNESREEGGIAPDAKPSAQAKAQLDKNMQFMMNNKMYVTPIILYKTVNGLVKMDQGMPQQNTQALVNNLSNKWE